MKNQSNRGFSLLELSIVLGIIGVIVAGVLVGRTMIVSSRLQTVMTDAGNYISAVGNFKSAYQALPGDFSNAQSLWGTDSSGCPSGGGSTGTCNGNGDGKVGPVCNGGSIDMTYSYESFRVWQHLNSAGLIASSLSGISASGSYGVAAGINVPRSSFEGGSFNLLWLDDPSLCGNYWDLIPSSGRYGNVLSLTGSAGVGGAGDPALLTPEQADNVDRKMDDGIPDTGVVRTSGTSVLPNCILHPSGYTYNLTYTKRACSLMFLTNY